MWPLDGRVILWRLTFDFPVCSQRVAICYKTMSSIHLRLKISFGSAQYAVKTAIAFYDLPGSFSMCWRNYQKRKESGFINIAWEKLYKQTNKIYGSRHITPFIKVVFIHILKNPTEILKSLVEAGKAETITVSALFSTSFLWSLQFVHTLLSLQAQLMVLLEIFTNTLLGLCSGKKLLLLEHVASHRWGMHTALKEAAGCLFHLCLIRQSSCPVWAAPGWHLHKLSLSFWCTDLCMRCSPLP